jgi:hypothetical protein
VKTNDGKYTKSVLPKLFSTATQFLERQPIATHIVLLDKKSSSKKNFLFSIEYNLTKKLDLFLIMRRVRLVRLFPVTVDDGIVVYVNASYLPLFFSLSHFLRFFNFYIIKKSHLKNVS